MQLFDWVPVTAPLVISSAYTEICNGVRCDPVLQVTVIIPVLWCDWRADRFTCSFLAVRHDCVPTLGRFRSTLGGQFS